MADNPVGLTDSAILELLEENLEHERKRLDALIRSGGSWLQRFRQRRAVQRAKWPLLWAETRALGSGHFIWRRGILGYGASMFVAMQILLPFSKGHAPVTIAEFVGHVLIGLPVWFAAGFGWGLWVWQATEKKYREVSTNLTRSRIESASE